MWIFWVSFLLNGGKLKIFESKMKQNQTFVVLGFGKQTFIQAKLIDWSRKYQHINWQWNKVAALMHTGTEFGFS